MDERETVEESMAECVGDVVDCAADEEGVAEGKGVAECVAECVADGEGVAECVADGVAEYARDDEAANDTHGVVKFDAISSSLA